MGYSVMAIVLIGAMMRPVTFGLVLPAGSPTREGRAAFVADLNRALSLIAGHFDSAWMIDHLQSRRDDLLESFTTTSYLAALHPQLRFGHTVVCQSFRNPALLAKMGATLQFLSGGRFILGLGAGWNEEEYRAYGYDFPPACVSISLRRPFRLSRRCGRRNRQPSRALTTR